MDVADCVELLELKSLTTLELKNNRLEDKDAIVPFFSQLKTLCSLYLQNNPCMRTISMYRKRMVALLPDLHQLDDRPVTELDHTFAVAFERGGLEEERKVKKELAEERMAKQRIEKAGNFERTEQAKKNRKIEMERMLGNLRV
jgi:hypothetical protein